MSEIPMHCYWYKVDFFTLRIANKMQKGKKRLKLKDIEQKMNKFTIKWIRKDLPKTR